MKPEVIYSIESNREKTLYQSPRDTAKAVLRGHSLAFSAFIIFFCEKLKTIALSIQPHKLEKEP